MRLKAKNMAGGIKKFVVGSFDDEKVLFPAVKNVRKAGYKIHDVYTPFPVHGSRSCHGHPRNEFAHCRFYLRDHRYNNCTYSCISWIFTKDWPLNIGGKPHFALPAWIPITFELTVLFSAVGMVLTFCYLCQLSGPLCKKTSFSVQEQLTIMFVMAVLNAPIKQMMPNYRIFYRSCRRKRRSMCR